MLASLVSTVFNALGALGSAGCGDMWRRKEEEEEKCAQIPLPSIGNRLYYTLRLPLPKIGSHNK